MIGNEIRLHLGKSLVKSMIKIQNVIELRGGHWAVRCFGKNGNCDSTTTQATTTAATMAEFQGRTN